MYSDDSLQPHIISLLNYCVLGVHSVADFPCLNRYPASKGLEEEVERFWLVSSSLHTPTSQYWELKCILGWKDYLFLNEVNMKRRYWVLPTAAWIALSLLVPWHFIGRCEVSDQLLFWYREETFFNTQMLEFLPLPFDPPFTFKGLMERKENSTFGHRQDANRLLLSFRLLFRQGTWTSFRFVECCNTWTCSSDFIPSFYSFSIHDH